MGRHTIGFGEIGCEEKDKQSIKEKMESMPNDILKIDDNLNFEMEGYGGLDYKALDELKEWAKENNIGILIQVSEYYCSDEGYYYDSDEEGQ